VLCTGWNSRSGIAARGQASSSTAAAMPARVEPLRLVLRATPAARSVTTRRLPRPSSMRPAVRRAAVYLGDPDVPIDTNHLERALRVSDGPQGLAVLLDRGGPSTSDHPEPADHVSACRRRSLHYLSTCCGGSACIRPDNRRPHAGGWKDLSPPTRCAQICTVGAIAARTDRLHPVVHLSGLAKCDARSYATTTKSSPTDVRRAVKVANCTAHPAHAISIV